MGGGVQGSAGTAHLEMGASRNPRSGCPLGDIQLCKKPNSWIKKRGSLADPPWKFYQMKKEPKAGGPYTRSNMATKEGKQEEQPYIFQG